MPEKGRDISISAMLIHMIVDKDGHFRVFKAFIPRRIPFLCSQALMVQSGSFSLHVGLALQSYPS